MSRLGKKAEKTAEKTLGHAAMARWTRRFRYALLCGALVCVAGCHRPAPTPDDPNAPPAAVPATQTLLTEMEGVWTTSEHAGTDDAETIYTVKHEGEGLRLFVDDEEWRVAIDDIDDSAGIVTLLHETNGPKEILTLRKVAATQAQDGGHFLHITFGNGQIQQLGFVRRISPADIQRMAEIQSTSGDGATASDEDRDDCDAAEDFREQQLCADSDLMAQHEALVSRFETLIQAETADIEATERSTWKQIDDCRTKRCLQDAYAHWIEYLDTNYVALTVE